MRRTMSDKVDIETYNHPAVKSSRDDATVNTQSPITGETDMHNESYNSSLCNISEVPLTSGSDRIATTPEVTTNNESNTTKVGSVSDLTEGTSFHDTASISPVSADAVVRSPAETERTEGSDDGSDYKDAEIIKENRNDVSDSESQAGSESSVEGLRTGRRNRRASDEIKDNYSDDESIEKGEGYEPQGARESGDGEEKTKDKVLDRDEDKKDPQYIPKKGVFYEHDDRTSDSGPATTTEEPKETKKKKFVADKIDRWGHDMYDTTKQSPKSTQDLIDYYGYDIRNEEEPPKAWRSRRYGRGPNKYTRQWQDEAAYRNKRPQPTKPPAPFKNNIEDFPTVEQSKSGYRRNRGRHTNTSPQESNVERRLFQNKPQNQRTPRQETRKKYHSEAPSQSPSNHTQPTLIDKPAPARENKFKDIQIEKTVFLNKKKPFSTMKTKSEAEAEADIAALSKEFSNAVINIGRDGKILPIGANTTNPGGNNNHLQIVEKVEMKEVPSVAEPPPQSLHQVISAANEMRPKERREPAQPVSNSKSKRYSSQRQRSLPQSNHLQQQPPQQQQQQFIHQQQFYPPPPPPQTTPETVPDPAIFSGFQGNPPPVYPDSMQGVVFLPSYPPTPPPHLLNYCPAPQQYGMPPPPPLGPPPPDMFPAQPPPGITYYSPQSQVQPRPPASRRVKVAIPIVAPPEQAQSDQTCS